MTKIYGGSDDLIEIEGEIEDEVNKIDAKNVNIECSDGTSAKISYTGEWVITDLVCGDLFHKHIKSVGDDSEHTEEDAKGCSSYSDVLVMENGLDWVRIGRKTFKP